MKTDQFNSRYQIGTPVFAYPGARPEDDSNATRLVSRTRSEASVLGGHTEVVWVVGHSACIALSHVDVVTEEQYEAAKLADAVAAQGAVSVSAGPEPQPVSVLDRARNALGARMAKDDLRLVLENVIAYAAGLESERHSTNESLSAAAEALRVQRDRIAGLEAQRERRRLRLIALQNDALSMRGSLSPNGEDRKVPFPLGETLTPAVDWLIARVAELEAAQGTVFRASHDSIVMGLYTTAAEARKHCETLIRRDIPGASLDWIEDEEDGVAELVAAFGEDERSTGYVVTALQVSSEYDEEADE